MDAEVVSGREKVSNQAYQPMRRELDILQPLSFNIDLCNMPNTQLWIEPLGHVIVARLRGDLNENMLEETHQRVVQLLQDTGYTRVLYDGLEMESPNVELALVQAQLDKKTKQMFNDRPIRKAILVPNTRLAYLARIAFGQFGEGEYRVFYNDLAQALQWLEE